MTDILAGLTPEQWEKIEKPPKWKEKFEMTEEIMKKMPENGGEIANSQDMDKFLKAIVNYYDEQHVFTRQNMLDITLKLAKGLPPAVWKKHIDKWMEKIIVQLEEKKQGYAEKVLPAMMELWKIGGDLSKNMEQIKKILANKNGAPRGYLFKFLTEVSYTGSKQFKEVLKDKDTQEKILKMTSDIDNSVRVAATQLLLQLEAQKLIDKKLEADYKKYKEDKRGKKIVGEAIVANQILAAKYGDKTAAPATEKKPAAATTKPAAAPKKGEKKDGGDEKKDVVPASGGDAGAAVATDGPKKKKKVKKIRKVKKAIGGDVKLKDGGILETGVPKNNTDCHKYDSLCKGYKENDVLDKLVKDSSDEKIKAAKPKWKWDKAAIKTKYGVTNETHLEKITKIGERSAAASDLLEKVKAKTEFNSDEIDELFALTIDMQGWTGTDSNNPTLVKSTCLMIAHALKNYKHGKKEPYHPGILGKEGFVPYLLLKIGDSKFKAEATELAYSMSYAMGPMTLFSKLMSSCLEKDIITKERYWCEVINFISDAIDQFGIQNFNPVLILNVTHKLFTAAKKEGKDPCYKLLATVYQQLGPKWEKAILGPLKDRPREQLLKKMKEMKNVGEFQQKRIKFGEEPPGAREIEVDEEYEEEVDEEEPVKPKAVVATTAPAIEAVPVESTASVVETVVPMAAQQPVIAAPKEPTPEPELPEGAIKGERKDKDKRMKKWELIIGAKAQNGGKDITFKDWTELSESLKKAGLVNSDDLGKLFWGAGDDKKKKRSTTSRSKYRTSRSKTR